MTLRRYWPFYLVLMGLVPGAMQIWSVWQLEPDGISVITGKSPAWDFTNLWAGGVLAASGRVATIFDFPAYADWLRTILGPRAENHEWSYPPSMLLLGVPLARLPLLYAYAVWTALTLGALWLALRSGGLSLAVCAAAILSPGALNNAAFGQNGALTAALLVGALLLADKRPAVAGVLMGLLTVKPQLGILLPVCVIASRNWRAFIAAALTGLALVAVTGLAFGWQVWALFLSETGPKMRSILEAPWRSGFQLHAVTVFAMARAADAPVPVAYAIQAVAAFGAAIVAWRAWRIEDADPVARMALTVCLVFLASPYGYSYDMAAFSAASAASMALGGWPVSIVEAVIWLWPGVVHLVNPYFPLTPVVAASAAWFAWRRLRPSALAPATVAR